MHIRWTVPTILAALLLTTAAGAADKGPSPEDVAKGQKVVEELLTKANARDPGVKPIADDAVTETLPACLSYAVLFRQFPVAVAPLEPFKSANVVIVKDGKAELIGDVAALEKFFKANLKPVKDEAGAKAAASAWLRLSQELKQDGYFKFSIPDKELSGDAKKASGKAVVDPQGGNKGDISVTLSFEDGKLVKVEEKANVLAGIRPRCQATKLLDPDPIVREIAEKDILVMGQACQAYLNEQRAKASPELRRAIDRLWQRILDEGR